MEITTSPPLLERLALAGALVTINAIGCQIRIVPAVLGRGGDDLVAVRDSRLLPDPGQESSSLALSHGSAAKPGAAIERCQQDAFRVGEAFLIKYRNTLERSLHLK